MKTKTFETYCPIFPGFYCTLFDESERFVEYETSDPDEFRERYPEFAGDVEAFTDAIDWRSGSIAVAKACVDALPELLPASAGEAIRNAGFTLSSRIGGVGEAVLALAKAAGYPRARLHVAHA